jgi:hypothetical protein
LAGLKEAGGFEPVQKRGEIREQLDKLVTLEGAGIDEIQGQLVSQEKGFGPISRLASRTAHVPSLKKI